LAAKSNSSDYLVLGARGQLAQAFLQRLGKRAIGVERAQCDLAEGDAIARVLRHFRPRVVLNCAAFNNVDLAETQHRQALLANATGPAALAEAAGALGIRLVHFSTDYVFGADGLRRPRTEEEPPAPMNFYGYSKLLGEEAVLRSAAKALVVRVAHLYGGTSRSPGRANLVERFVQQARAGNPIRVTRGQMLNPTSVQDVVAACLVLLDRGEEGLFHLTGEGCCSAEEFARAVLEMAGIEGEIQVVARDARPAPRAAMTVLENRRWAEMGFAALPPWRESLERYISGL